MIYQPSKIPSPLKTSAEGRLADNVSDGQGDRNSEVTEVIPTAPDVDLRQENVTSFSGRAVLQSVIDEINASGGLGGFQSSPRLEWWFKSRSWEQWDNCRIYRTLGVHHFGKFLPQYPLQYMTLSDVNGEQNRTILLERLDRFTRYNEQLQVVMGAGALAVAAVSLATLEPTGLIIASVSAVGAFCLGVVPVAWQRFNRARVTRMLQKIRANSADSA